MIRDIIKRVIGFSSAACTVCTPWPILIVRIWLGQLVFVHRIMTIAENGHLWPPRQQSGRQDRTGPMQSGARASCENTLRRKRSLKRRTAVTGAEGVTNYQSESPLAHFRSRSDRVSDHGRSDWQTNHSE